jgi:hypothetical protein
MNTLLDLVRSLRLPTRANPAARDFRPCLEVMEDRLVPATVDLTTAGSVGALNGAIFQQADPQPTGCGVIHDFLRIQGSGVEQGYNTDGRPLQFDEKKSPVFTRSLQLSAVPTISFNGTVYYEFLLGVNQKASAPLISLDELRLYQGNAPDLLGYDSATHQLAGLSPVCDMSTGGPNSVTLDSRLSHGNGSGDMFLYVPQSDFTGSGPYVYLYSKFGVNYGANGGFEQWAAPRVATLPPGLSSLSGTVFLDNNKDFVFDAGDTGLAGITVTLTGTNSLGQAVSISTTTNPSGFYSFTNLFAGTYTITETGPATFQNIGTVNGTPNGSTAGIPGVQELFSGIQLPANSAGINYNFGEQLMAGS